MTDVQAQVTRTHAIEQSVDPLGNKWGIAHRPQTSLYYIGKVVKDEFNPAKEVAKEPRGYPADYLKGHFTKIELANAEISKYLVEAWDKSDEVAKKAAGKQRAKAQKEEELATSKETQD